MQTAQNTNAAVDLLLKSFVTDKSAAIITMLIPVAVSGVTIYFIMIGTSIARGMQHRPINELFGRILKVSVITGLALNVGMYQTVIVDGLESIGGAILQAISGTTNFAGLLDNMAEPFAALGEKLWSQATVGVLPRIGLLFAAAIVSLAQTALFSVGLGFYLVAKVAVALTMALGPAFLLCAIWPATEKYAENWLGQTLNYIFLKLLVSTTIVMLTSFASQFAEHLSLELDALNVVRASCALLISCIALVIVMLLHPQLATALFGGASISGAGRAAMHMLLYLLSAKTPHSPAANPPNQVQRGRSTPNSSASNQLVNASPLYSRNSLQKFHRQYSRRTP